MVEITKQFKVEVKRLRKNTGVKGTDTDILPSKAHHTLFSKNASDVMKTIAQVLGAR